MTQYTMPFWSPMVQTFGTVGTIVILLAALIVLISSLVTPLFVRRLYRQNSRIETLMSELKAAHNRQQQVDRLQRDRESRRPRRRR
jgi:Tfp pilus assembly protein PilN